MSARKISEKSSCAREGSNPRRTCAEIRATTSLLALCPCLLRDINRFATNLRFCTALPSFAGKMVLARWRDSPEHARERERRSGDTSVRAARWGACGFCRRRRSWRAPVGILRRTFLVRRRDAGDPCLDDLGKTETQKNPQRGAGDRQSERGGEEGVGRRHSPWFAEKWRRMSRAPASYHGSLGAGMERARWGIGGGAQGVLIEQEMEGGRDIKWLSTARDRRGFFP